MWLPTTVRIVLFYAFVFFACRRDSHSTMIADVTRRVSIGEQAALATVEEKEDVEGSEDEDDEDDDGLTDDQRQEYERQVLASL